MTWPFGDLRTFGYDVIVADPPWDFELYSENGNRKGAAPHYKLMSTPEIKALPVGHLARGDSLILLWGTSPHLPQCLDVLAGWGAVYKTMLVWRKVTRTGKVRWGTGYRARTGHEIILVGTIGNPAHKPFPSIFDGVAREHSRKPDEFYEIVLRHCPHAFRCDLFARQSRPGFDAWGNEATKFDKAA